MRSKVAAALLWIVLLGACEAEPGEDRTVVVPVVELELQAGRVDVTHGPSATSF